MSSPASRFPNLIPRSLMVPDQNAQKTLQCHKHLYRSWRNVEASLISISYLSLVKKKKGTSSFNSSIKRNLARLRRPFADFELRKTSPTVRNPARIRRLD